MADIRNILSEFESELEGLIAKFAKELTDNMEDERHPSDDIREIQSEFEDRLNQGLRHIEEGMLPLLEEAERLEDGDLI